MNPTKRIYPNASDEILQAAETVAIDEGLASLTIDRVAAVSGKSKGGVLYHFPTKEALIKGMIDRIGQAQICGHSTTVPIQRQRFRRFKPRCCQFVYSPH
jgi:AcrR family transcriptional regulator